ncbi:hypothetical protein G1K75_12705 [Tenacibaculum finnmarkense]|uniref:hypothetical protein n=1 Tax=Tenacibaculum finnmarkense TaxID=2781243 RepID=UPI00187B2F5B|nr:hypothetical protein [Tenacibaculum finnmarkense]MBE7635115.1 hypothetical protein [Tenacibaculum finnmarkense genomovar ulcerans]MCD8403799.1 hypothetical protein [Tenacibaculum finnmarkense genomovar finnmarkense]MCD8431118.1 hypothetical protein [Tenacibaculum finnmarkense genomovar ulcerans]MCD8433604.1 hypothetical protein [Tenacibaculum finnmarkense genomovar ulcerans]MCG8806512.1 hypothetical protein [Tenacibaculum finnmarkense]
MTERPNWEELNEILKNDPLYNGSITKEEKFPGFREFLINYYTERLTIDENYRIPKTYSNPKAYNLRISTKDFNELIKSNYKSFTDHIVNKNTEDTIKEFEEEIKMCGIELIVMLTATSHSDYLIP